MTNDGSSGPSLRLPGEVPTRYTTGSGGYILAHDKILAELASRHTSWNVTYLFRLALPTLWTAYRLPVLQSRDGNEMEHLIAQVDDGHYVGPQTPPADIGPEIAWHNVSGSQTAWELDRHRDGIMDKHPNWRVWWKAMLDGPPRWEAQRVPLITRESPGILSRAIETFEATGVLDDAT